ncbi:MAG: Anucleate primary sterigmata protein B [Geoglossum umbratile]|nr:MAG: Anucleate primary sterigmata protein B [Geoglossum umbratile]
MPPSRPGTANKESQRVPGGFSDDDVELSPLRPSFQTAAGKPGSQPFGDVSSSSLPPLPQNDSSLLHPLSDDGATKAEDDGSALNEREMRRQLMDVESSFLPEPSFDGHPGGGAAGADDTFVFGAPKGDMGPPPHPSVYKEGFGENAEDSSFSPPTPPDSYRTPAPPDTDTLNRMNLHEDGEMGGSDATSPSGATSSPAAAAAARTVSRVVSMATVGGYETADDGSHEADTTDGEATPRKRKGPDASFSQASTLKESHKLRYQQSSGNGNPENADATDSRRPKFLRSRHASQRSSGSSFASLSGNSIDGGGSDVTLGADFALQSGGAAPVNSSTNSGPSFDLSRSTSFGSIASGVTGFSEGASTWERSRTVSGTSATVGSSGRTAERNLARLDEEERRSRERAKDSEDKVTGPIGDDLSPPVTPRPTGRTLRAPTDTIIAQHVRDIQVPASVAREYRENNRPLSPEKRSSMPTPIPGRSKKNLTLKEQSSTIDRLTKENFDLKLKIHYLNNALNERSEEGVKEMISENVELKAGLVTLQKETRGLRRTVRDLERKLKEREDGLVAAGGTRGDGDRSSPSIGREGVQDMEEEVNFLRERVETYEIEVERLRREGVSREAEKRRVADVIRGIGERKGADGDLGAREEIDMWKDLLDAETARREQADEENKKLREEIWRLKNDGSSTTTNLHTSTIYNTSKRQTMSSGRSLVAIGDSDRNGAVSAASSTLVEQLRHENEELRREVGAQTSMLTSRNREKERLYQEIEDLKLGILRGDGVRSAAGDSFFERSASRAHERTHSRASGITQVTVLSDAERDEYENQNGTLRDRISELKLKNQELERQLEGCLDELDRVDAEKSDLEKLATGYEEEIELATQDLQTLQAERDEALKLHEELEADFEELRNEAQTEIDALEREIIEKSDSVRHLETDLANRDENFNALQAEMRLVSEDLVKLEDDHQANHRKMQKTQQELEDANRELETLEKNLIEANGKVERLAVQQESSQNEIGFLREEQDGDKIKIGNLETALEKAEATVQDERERVKELEKRLADERHQREVVGSKEKQEVQRMMNDLNREASGAKDETRRLKKSLSSREAEAREWKERLMELESSLREALGEIDSTRSSLLRDINKLQGELDATLLELDSTRNALAEKDSILKDRDALLENTGLERRKLSELLEKERQARRSDRQHFEQTQRTQTTTHQTISQHQSQVTELETQRQRDKKKITALEAHYKEQLTERNNLLLALWNRLSALCGPDWAHKNSLVNGKLPSLEVIATMLPGFKQNLMLAVKTIEGIIHGFKSRIRGVERDLWKEYQSLEHNLDIRTKKLERLEIAVHSGRVDSSNSSAEIMKLKGENRLLKAELSVLNKQRLAAQQRAHNASAAATTTSASPTNNPPPLHRTVTLPGPTTTSTTAKTTTTITSSLTRHNSASSAPDPHHQPLTTLPHSASSTSITSTSASAPAPAPTPRNPEDERWISRLRELEKRLKRERETRMLERKGATRRLEEGKAENEELRGRLERERVRNEAVAEAEAIAEAEAALLAEGG